MVLSICKPCTVPYHLEESWWIQVNSSCLLQVEGDDIYITKGSAGCISLGLEYEVRMTPNVSLLPKPLESWTGYYETKLACILCS